MAVFFDYTTLLQNSMQIAVSKLTAGSDDESWVSEAVTNPSSEVFFSAVLDPGHEGTSTKIEYYLGVDWVSDGVGDILAYEWQIKPSGGAFVTLTGASGNVTSGGDSTIYQKDTGTYGTSTLLPAEIQLIGTDADAAWNILKIGGDAGTNNLFVCAMRTIGTV